MTSDDWSLKGKLKTIAEENIGFATLDGTETMPVYDLCYEKDDIETLRQKIINDIKKLEPITDCDDNSDYMDGFFMGYESAQDSIKIIINERFGVE